MECILTFSILFSFFKRKNPTCCNWWNWSWNPVSLVSPSLWKTPYSMGLWGSILSSLIVFNRWWFLIIRLSRVWMWQSLPHTHAYSFLWPRLMMMGFLPPSSESWDHARLLWHHLKSLEGSRIQDDFTGKTFFFFDTFFTSFWGLLYFSNWKKPLLYPKVNLPHV